MKNGKNFDALYNLFLGGGNLDCRRAAAAAIEELGPSNDPNPVFRLFMLTFHEDEWIRAWEAAYYPQSRLMERLRGLTRLAKEHRGQMDASLLASETFTGASTELLTGWLAVKGPLQEGAILELLHRDAGNVIGLLHALPRMRPEADRQPLARWLIDALLASERRPDTGKAIAINLSLLAGVPPIPDGQDWEDWWASNKEKFAPKETGAGTASN